MLLRTANRGFTKNNSWGKAIKRIGTNKSVSVKRRVKIPAFTEKDLEAVSHAGNFQQWLTNNKSMLANLKAQNPISYQGFMEKFTVIKSQLKQKGVLQ